MEYNKDALYAELAQLQEEHKELDKVTEITDGDSELSEFDNKRIKKRKLWLKDRISNLQSILYPEVIA